MDLRRVYRTRSKKLGREDVVHSALVLVGLEVGFCWVHWRTWTGGIDRHLFHAFATSRDILRVSLAFLRPEVGMSRTYLSEKMNAPLFSAQSIPQTIVALFTWLT
jgi:hypothetical protein